jgi:hypothetical protein
VSIRYESQSPHHHHVCHCCRGCRVWSGVHFWRQERHAARELFLDRQLYTDRVQRSCCIADQQFASLDRSNTRDTFRVWFLHSQDFASSGAPFQFAETETPEERQIYKPVPFFIRVVRRDPRLESTSAEPITHYGMGIPNADDDSLLQVWQGI